MVTRSGTNAVPSVVLWQTAPVRIQPFLNAFPTKWKRPREWDSRILRQLFHSLANNDRGRAADLVQEVFAQLAHVVCKNIANTNPNAYPKPHEECGPQGTT